MKPKLVRFATATAFACPLCKKSLTLHENCFKCDHRHSFDLAKFGYINLAPQIKQSKEYDKDNFIYRQNILESGFYQHILQEIEHILQDLPDKHTILDAGCGEGYYSRKLQKIFPTKSYYAFDISKDSILLASKNDTSHTIKWFVGDLANLPIKNHSIDLILDIFSPANYQEFQRVLTDNGLLIKVIPTKQHVKEIRNKVAKQLTNQDYSNQEILKHFEKYFDILEQREVCATYSINEDQKEALIRMTPLLFHIRHQAIDWSDLKEITISATILVGKAKK